MKKLLSLALAMLMALGATAAADNTLVFVDHNGNTVADGATIEVTTAETDPYGTLMLKSGLSVKNTAGVISYGSMTLTISTLSNGILQHCYPGSCVTYSSTGTVVRSESAMMSAGAVQDIQSEWLPVSYGLCTVAYTIRVLNADGSLKTTGPTVTVRYNYQDPNTAGGNRPVITPYNYNGMYLMGLSDNGQFGLIYGSEECTTSPMIVNLATKSVTSIQSESDIATNGVCTAKDISDNGRIIVGSLRGCPAFYNTFTGAWTTLGNEPGECLSVTPDGKYAVGFTTNGMSESGEIGWWDKEWGHLWNLETGREEDMAFNQPYTSPKDVDGTEDMFMVRFTHISPDGRYVLGRVSDGACYYAFISDRQADDWSDPYTYIGYKSTDGGLSFQPVVNNLFFCEPMSMSPNGEWVCCDAYIVNNLASGGTNEYTAALRYNVKTGAIDCYDNTTEDQNMLAGCIDNNGTVFAGTPSDSPIREFYVRHDGYWYSLRSILNQKYNIDFQTATALDNTGTPLGISSDGNTIVSMVDPQFGQNFCLQMKESITGVCAGLNLLGVYSFAPTPGSAFARLGQIRLTFDRDVEVVPTASQTAATFGDWTSLGGNGIYVDPTDAKTVIVAFRSRTLEVGKNYTFKLPAGTVCIKGDRLRTNADISATFTGRADAAVAVVSVYPADGSTLAKIDNASSPILIGFDTNVALSETAAAALYTSDGQKVSNLTVAYKDASVALYPSTTQYLFEGTSYIVVLEEGSVTDVCGAGGNAKITLHYTGSYERQVSADDVVLFSDDFNSMSSSLATWMLYEGDHNTPVSDLSAQYEFDADNTPWNFSIRDDEDYDYCAASHSNYTNNGASNDWMVTPQIFLPDGFAKLSFDAQSLSATKADRLKVIVWESNDVYNTLSADVVSAIQSQGKVVFDQQLSNGGTEGTLAGEWTHCTVDLAAFAGKSVYIAFVNQNAAQSMVFVDNVLVQRDLLFLLSLTSKQSVVRQSGITIAGTVTGNSADKRFTIATLTLRNADGQTVDVIKQDGLSLGKGDACKFTFSKPLPLTMAEVNKFSIDVDLDGNTASVNSSIKNLDFEPVKRVVLEEMTGTTCGNCPLGIVAIGIMERDFGEHFIPVSIHTYDGDAWGSNLSPYSAYLGLSAAPTGVINRSGVISNPMETYAKNENEVDARYTNGSDLWYDLVSAEINTPTDFDVSAKLGHNTANGTFSVDATVRSALNVRNLNLNVFMVLMEDGLVSFQHNYFAANSYSVLGEWGQGGRYAQGTVYNVTHNDVVRMCYGNSFAGTGGMLPQQMNAGQEYTACLSGEVPGTVENVANAKVAVMLIDANTDRIVNACVVKFRDADTPVDAAKAAATDRLKTYNLQGIEVDGRYHGIVIRGGKKFLQ